jgi:hypothetical protein
LGCSCCNGAGAGTGGGGGGAAADSLAFDSRTLLALVDLMRGIAGHVVAFRAASQ